MKPPIKFADPKDADRFVVGHVLWSPDFKTWYPGAPPAPKPGGQTITVTAVDRERGVITVK